MSLSDNENRILDAIDVLNEFERFLFTEKFQVDTTIQKSDVLIEIAKLRDILRF